jgi:hypothetical protein
MAPADSAEDHHGLCSDFSAEYIVNSRLDSPLDSPLTTRGTDL